MSCNLPVLVRKLLYAQVIFLLSANLLIAQEPCDDNAIMAIKGKWAKRADANLNSNNQVQMISRIKKMQLLLQAAYPEPTGIEAAWYMSMGGHNSSVNANATSYVLNALFKAYYCNKNVNKLLLGGETGTWFYIWVNKFSWFAELVTFFTINQQPTYLLTARDGELKGYLAFKGIDNETANTGTRYSRTVLISRNGSSPYTPVSRKQYLNAVLEFNNKKLAEELAMIEKYNPAKTEAEEEENKKQQLEKIEKTTAPAKVERSKQNFLQNYVTDKQRKESLIADTKTRKQAGLKNIQNVLDNSTDTELQSPAILKGYDVLTFRGFSTAEDGGQELVCINPAYFDNELPSYVPQFLIVYWKWDKNKPAENFRDQLEANFDFQKLKEMLDK